MRADRQSGRGRWGKPDDVAGIAVFLAERGSAFLTPTATAVDGGCSSLG